MNTAERGGSSNVVSSEAPAQSPADAPTQPDNRAKTRATGPKTRSGVKPSSRDAIDAALELFKTRPGAAQLFEGREELLARWVVVSSSEEVGRSQTVILDEGRDLLAIDHAGSEIIAVRTVLQNVDGSLPTLYWTSKRRTAQMAVVLGALGKPLARGELADRLGEDGFCADTYAACAPGGTKEPAGTRS